jgi:hypothetical protein|tara:strand:+ start:896 stop:1207 length:312 start_codon:yes stop_codon:yes gene_type:complete
MGNWENDPEEEPNGLTEIEQMQMDAILLETAYNNAWQVLSGNVSFDLMMKKQFTKGAELVLPYDPEKGPKKDELENMIAYYIETEEYEKCAKLTQILKEKYGN